MCFGSHQSLFIDHRLRVTGYAKSARTVWTSSEGKTLGLVRGYKQLTTCTVVKAGHMVPMDQPEAAQQMFANFVSKTIGSSM